MDACVSSPTTRKFVRCGGAWSSPANVDSVWVKICGVTNPVDAQVVVASGADAIGFNFWAGSARYIEPLKSGWIAEVFGVERVAVLVDPTLDDALTVSALDGIDCIQLHGNEAPDFCQRLVDRGVKIMKALPATPDLWQIALSDYACARILLDTAVRGRFGGLGEIFDWSIASEFARRNSHLEVIIAGGLTPANVGEAIATAKPAGVDVSGGVEISPGRKDHELIRRFVAAAHGS